MHDDLEEQSRMYCPDGVDFDESSPDLLPEQTQESGYIEVDPVKPKPPLADQKVFGLGWDVVILAFAFTLSIGFVVYAIRDFVDNVLEKALEKSGKAFRVAKAVSDSEHLLPVFLGGLFGPMVMGKIAVLAGYQAIDIGTAIYLGVTCGALSKTTESYLRRVIERYRNIGKDNTCEPTGSDSRRSSNKSDR